MFIEAITYMRWSNFYGDDGSYLSLLPNSLRGLGVAGGQGGRFFCRQLSGRCVITTLAAVWADAWSCQAPTAALHVAEKISVFQDTDLSCDTMGTFAETVGLGPRVFTCRTCALKGLWDGADYERF